jgi:hypothetical protein
MKRVLVMNVASGIDGTRVGIDRTEVGIDSGVV